MKLFKRLFCRHDWELIKPVYGDMKNRFRGYYRCKKCNKETLR